MDCSPPGSSVHGILQERMLEWVSMPFSKGSSQSRDQMQVSHIAGGFFTVWAIREAPRPQKSYCHLFMKVYTNTNEASKESMKDFSIIIFNSIKKRGQNININK